MPPFPKPRFDYSYDVDHELAALRTYQHEKPGRQIPRKARERLLVGTWNLANLGVQDRLDDDYALIAEIVSWFDLVAVQEVNDDLRGIEAIHSRLPSRYDLLFSDASGNQERQAFLYDARKVARLREVGRLSIPPSQLARIRVPGATTLFTGFDRGPYLASFGAGSFRFSLRDAHSYVPDIVPLGDFNLPKAAPGDRIFDALVSLGLAVPPHSSQIGSAIASDSYYDQIAFFPGITQARFTGASNVFDFDGALFRDLWNDPQRTPKQFLAYARFHISDHRPLWAEFRTG